MWEGGCRLSASTTSDLATGRLWYCEWSQDQLPAAGQPCRMLLFHQSLLLWKQRFSAIKDACHHVYALLPRRGFVLFILFSKGSEIQKRLRTAVESCCRILFIFPLNVCMSHLAWPGFLPGCRGSKTTHLPLPELSTSAVGTYPQFLGSLVSLERHSFLIALASSVAPLCTNSPQQLWILFQVLLGLPAAPRPRGSPRHLAPCSHRYHVFP